ncbi:restriction endonuclease subunit S [Aquaspirillum soli]
MAAIDTLITDHLDLWTTALKRKSTAGRGSSSKVELYGIKKLRELILELAVRGLLVPQDPNDEPASELLKRIAAEKAKLVQAGKIKKEKPLPSIGYEEEPFKLPCGWSFLRLGEVLAFEYGDNLPEAKRSGTGEFPVFGSNGVVGSHNESFVTGQCIVIGRKGSAGALNLCLEEGCCVTDVAYYCIPPAELSIQFIFKMLHTLGLDSLGKGIKPGLNRNEAYALIIPVPPLAEQHRIVAKVDELMVLCDQLEQETDASLGAHQTLVETLLSALTSAADHAQFASAWQRIAGHFDTLFTTEESIAQLKQTILQLAVMGKLVPQDPNDEPASELLKKIATEKAKLVKEGKIKKEKPLSPVSEQEMLFELPSAWSWARFGSIVSFESELVAPQDFQNFDQVAPDSIEKGTGKLLCRRTVAETGITGPNNRFYAGQILYSKIRPSLSKAVIAEFDGLCSADMYPLGVIGLSKRFLLKVILSEPFLAQVRREENRIKMPKLNIPSLSNFLIAVPPLKEQHRIVAKVDELMALCDQLKSRLADAQITQLHLADALVEQAIG